jgi:hypothetical protein
MKFWRGFIIVILFLGCRDKYVVQTNTPPAGFLVVEGFINVNGTTNIMMTRSSSLDSPMLIPEPGAQVEVQSDNGVSFLLTENPGGHYSGNAMILDPAQQYRLHILTTNGREYLSDLTAAKITPPIDTVTWTGNSTAVTIYVSTHDSQNQPGYYQWQFDETWKYSSAFSSTLEYVDDQLIPRPDSDGIYYCWRSDVSTNINVASTEKLSENVISNYPLTEIPYATSDKLIDKYSILVRQYSLTKEWYEWNQKIKKNTEQLGSIFDAQPSETGGNIHCVTDPTETVVGFVGCTTETQKRIFISRYDIPPAVILSGYEFCIKDTIGLDPSVIHARLSQGFYLPVHPVYILGLLKGYEISGPDCVDCRLKGGTTVKPPFWQ